MHKMKKKVLYISYDGILEPLGNSQVLKYLEHLSDEFIITLISYEKLNGANKSEEFLKMEQHCKDKNILWSPKKYRTGLGSISSLCNLLSIFFSPFFEMLVRNHHIIHIRSYMPGIAMPFLKLFFNFKLIFDIRGFWADEKVDRLGWKNDSIKYKFFKSLELRLFQKSNIIVTLTKSSKEYIHKQYNIPSRFIRVIRTCVDFNEFNIKHRKSFGYDPSKALRIGYLGSIDTAYDFDHFLRFVKNLNEKNLKIELKILSNTSKEKVRRYLQNNKLEHINHEVLFLKRNELSGMICDFDLLGFALKESFSLIASMPTKIGESLACGTPIICNNFNSDIEEMMANNKIGFLNDFCKPLSEVDFQKILSIIEDDSTSRACFDFSKKHFSLPGGVEIYREIYNR